jgi:hypothetical protein
MCEQCVEVDIQLERCRRLKSRVNDQQTEAVIARMIVDLEARKATLHPERD